MFSEMILKITNSVYWDFLSTLSAMLLGIFFTWLFSKHYYGKANEHSRRLNAIWSKEFSKVGKEKFDIKYDEKGMPIEIVFIPTSGTLNTKGKLKAVKTKATNKDN